MTVLGIETSTAVCAVGLVKEGGGEVERAVTESRIHSERLVPFIREVVREAGVELRDLSAVAVSIGPGSFTGLRIGLSTAKGLCAAIGKPLVAVPTFVAIARQAFRREPALRSVAVLIDAKQGEWYVGLYDREGDEAIARDPVRVAAADAALIPGDVSRVLSDQVPAIAAALGPSKGVRSVLECCSGLSVAAVGGTMLRQNGTADLSSLEPVYLKDFVVRSRPAATNDVHSGRSTP